MKKFLPIVALLIALFAVGSVAAQTQTQATITASPDNVTVGDPIQLTVTAIHPAGTQAIWPQLEATWGDFIVRGQSPVTTTDNGDGTVTSTQIIDARLFAPGAFQTPPLTITIADSSGQTSSLTAVSIPITVQSVLVDGDTQLRDIKPQSNLPLPASWPWIAAGLAALAAAILWLAYRRGRAASDNRLPHEVALDALTAVEKQQLAENGRFKEHYSLVTNTLRAYVEQTQAIQATDRTTTELKSELQKTTLTTQQARQFIDLLQAGDLVKFARFTPDVTSAHALVGDARAFIEATKPLPEEKEQQPKKKDRRLSVQSPISTFQSSQTEATP